MGESEKFKYEYWRYDKHFVLKPPLALKISLVVLCKDLILSLLLGATNFKSKGSSLGSDAVDIVQPVFILSALPAAALFLAMVARGPDAGTITRFVWRNGRILITLSVLTYLALFLASFGFEIRNYSVTHGFMFLAYAIILTHCWRSTLLKDVFLEFPDKGTK